MATSSITKKYVIKDDNACDKLIQVLTEDKFTRKKKPASKKYEEGKKLLAQYYSRSES